MIKSSNLVLAVAALLGASISCSSAKHASDDSGRNAATGSAGNPSASGPSSPLGSGGSAQASDSGGAGAMSPQPGTAGSKQGSAGSVSGASGSPGGGTAGTTPPTGGAAMLDPSIDWTALKLVFSPMYSAFDGMHTFQVPVHVDGVTVDISDWQAIPENAVTFDPDPEGGGVLVTVLEGADEITIAAANGVIGGTAPLRITTGTPEQWEAGKARYNNGVVYSVMVDFASIIDPNWVPPIPPPNLACNNCHSPGAIYFEIEHTPTQAARFSDEDLTTIFTKGVKPPGIGFHVIPEMVGNTSNVDLYSMFHKWDATADEIKGLIIYLRSLTPKGQEGLGSAGASGSGP